MGRHTGHTCFICGQVFTDQDDVVVCADCGTPYHRNCWKSVGSCANTTLHANGGTWQAPEVDLPPTEEAKQSATTERAQNTDHADNVWVCKNCGAKNAKGETHCANCGSFNKGLIKDYFTDENFGKSDSNKDFAPEAEEVAYCGLEPEEDLGEMTVREVAQCVGKNRFYYLARFRKIFKTGRQLQINVLAIIFPYIYFAYRKMYIPAIVTMGVLLMLSLPQMVCNLQQELPTIISSFDTDTSPYYEMGKLYVPLLQSIQDYLDAHEVLLSNLSLIFTYIGWVFHLIIGLFANFLYYRHIQKKVKEVRALPVQTEDMKRTQLSMRGGVNFWVGLGSIMVYYIMNSLAMALIFAIFMLIV